MSLFCAWSLRKWYLISICLVLQCCARFFYMLITLILSHLIGTCSKDKPKSLSICFIQRICAQHKLIAMYLVYVFGKTSKFWFLLCHETSECLKKWHMPPVIFLSILQPTKLAFEKPINSKLSLLGYHKPMSIVLFKYLRCHAPKPTPRTWRSFHTSSPKAQSGNDTNIRIVTGNLPITKFLFRVVGQNSKVSEYQLFLKKINTSTRVLLSK